MKKNRDNDDSRNIFISGELDEENTKKVIERMLELQEISINKPISIIIDSYGGNVDSMFAITDVMDILVPDVNTICVGKAMSASAFIFICGTNGKRLMSKTSRLMLHQMSQCIHGDVKDLDIYTEEIKYLQSVLVHEISKRSKLSVSSVEDIIDRERYIRPNEAIKMGLCDGIIRRLQC